jgi:hypothetical protein
MGRTVPGFIHRPFLGRNTGWGIEKHCRIARLLWEAWRRQSRGIVPCHHACDRIGQVVILARTSKGDSKAEKPVAVAIVSRRMPSTCGSELRFVPLTEAGGWNLCSFASYEAIITRISDCFVGPEMPSNVDMMKGSRQ